MEEKELVNHPAHYGSGPYEAIQVMEAWGEEWVKFHLSSGPVINLTQVLKYLCRHTQKGSPERDLSKADWYLSRARAQVGGLDPNDHLRTDHQKRVEQSMIAFGHVARKTPTIPPENERALWARLILEEAIEAINALGFNIHQEVELFGASDSFEVGISGLRDGTLDLSSAGDVDLSEIAKECADLSVVAMLPLSSCGIAARPILEAVDQNNFEKADTGSTDPKTGKFVKHPDHPKPDIEEILRFLASKDTRSFEEQLRDEMVNVVEPEITKLVDDIFRGGSEPLVQVATLLEADRPTANGNVYTKEALRKAFSDPHRDLPEAFLDPSREIKVEMVEPKEGDDPMKITGRVLIPVIVPRDVIKITAKVSEKHGQKLDQTMAEALELKCRICEAEPGEPCEAEHGTHVARFPKSSALYMEELEPSFEPVNPEAAQVRISSPRTVSEAIGIPFSPLPCEHLSKTADHCECPEFCPCQPCDLPGGQSLGGLLRRVIPEEGEDAILSTPGPDGLNRFLEEAAEMLGGKMEYPEGGTEFTPWFSKGNLPPAASEAPDATQAPESPSEATEPPQGSSGTPESANAISDDLGE